MPRFVIQEHQRQGEEIHWDLMLERGDELKTFRLSLHPSHIQAEPAQATPIGDHEKRFLTYEGPVNQGMGSVRIVEQGTFSTVSKTISAWTLLLHGTWLKGTFAIVRGQGESWHFRPQFDASENSPMDT